MKRGNKSYSFIASPAGTFSGFHCRSALANGNNGKWLLLILLLISPIFLHAQSTGLQKIIRAEYFLDVDPGFGNATKIDIPAAQDVTLPIDHINVGHLSEGIHHVFVRVQSDSLYWSLTQAHAFYRVKLRATPNITALEYFVDIDPGVGLAHKVNISVPGVNVVQYPVNIELDEESEGTHTLYLRARNAKGEWSITQQRTFQQFYQRTAPDLTALEYFIDDDPGFGHGVALSITGQNANRLFSVDVTDVEKGMHTLYIRARNHNRVWSITQSIVFVKAAMEGEPDIERVEYFIDRDPGFGKAHPVSINPGKSVSANFTVNPDTLAAGLHTLYLRARTVRGWAVTQSFSFIRMEQDLPSDIVGYEWFIDTDPGFGHAPSYATVSATTHLQKTIQVDVSSLDAGVHAIYVRVLDSRGRWSIVQRNAFIRAEIRTPEPVTALEWFIDHDPGFGQAHVEPASSTTVNVPITTTSFAPGIHTLYIRAKNSAGRWSITHSTDFVLMEDNQPKDVTAVEYFIDSDPGYGKATPVPGVTPEQQLIRSFTADLSQTGEGLHRLFVRARNSAGKWSITHYSTFVKVIIPEKAALAGMEWFIDDDPGFGQAHGIALTGNQAEYAFLLNLTDMITHEGLTVNDFHTLYFRAKNTAGRWGITQYIIGEKNQDYSFYLYEDTLKTPDVTAIEWFMDSDPGYGQATQLTGFTAGRTVIHAFPVNVTSLSEGWHDLFVRARNATGKWSVTQHQPFVKIKSRNLSALEYFIDIDPGHGHGTTISLSGSADSKMFTVPITGLADGIHTLFARAKNEVGAWSVTQYFTFVKVTSALQPSDISRVEWFVDVDPGFGAAFPEAVDGNGVALLHPNGVNYNEGDHTLYVRALNQAGRWGVTQQFTFYVMKVEPTAGITAVEWFIDNDPGFGLSPTNKPLTESEQITTSVIVPTTSLGEGMHRIYVRVRTAAGVWSLTQVHTFQKVVLPVKADLSAVEWFIDHDPGFGAGVRTNITGQSDNRTLNIDLDNIPEGMHTLYVRSLNTAGRWGITHSLPFIIAGMPDNIADVTAVEYFFDSDPGYGKATRVYSGAPGQQTQQTFAADASNLQAGMHTFFVRALNAKGKWGVTHYQTFLKSELPENYQPATMVKLEYFIDIDPGFGSALPIDLPAEISTGILFPVDIADLGDGPHTIYIRALDNAGKWSVTQTMNFYRTDLPTNINKDIVYLEYFVDNDPGFHKGTSILLNYPGEDISQSVFIPTDDMWPGSHVIYFRGMNGSGVWSITQYVDLMVIDNPRLGGYPDIVQIEWFLDNDPGFGQATLVPASPTGLHITQRIFIPMTDVSEGIHTLYIRGRNSKGEWSHTQTLPIFNMGVPVFDPVRSIVGFEYFVDADPGFGKAEYVTALLPDVITQQTVTVVLDTLSAGVHTFSVRAVDSEGVWSHTQRMSIMHVKVRPDYPISQLEYFIDRDPGFGKAVQVSITANLNIDRVFNVLLPDTLKTGIHTLYIRAKNTADDWSITQHLNFTKVQIRKIPNMVAMEYFIDSNPAFGAGEPMPVPTGDVPVSMFIPLTGYSEGFHTLYIRAKNSEGSWSITQNMEFTSIKLVRDFKITAVEYFVDTDPGFGEALAVPGIVPATTIDKTFSVDLEHFDAGLHTLYIRALDETGSWSLTQDITFLRLEEASNPQIVKAEYFIDEAPDFGVGTDIPVTAGTMVQKTVTISTAALSDGFHTIYVRVKDSDGSWSITQYRPFIKQSLVAVSPVTALEWFVDTDPGFGEATSVSVAGETSVVFPVNTVPEEGIHTLYVRGRNAAGRWSITQDLQFVVLKTGLSNIVALEYFIDSDPGYGQAAAISLPAPNIKIAHTFPVDISQTDDGIHTLFIRALDEAGHWSVTQYNQFVKVSKPEQADVTGLEWFVDIDPGFGKANPVSVAGNTSVLFPVVAAEAGIHTLYVRAKNSNEQWSITQNIQFIVLQTEQLPNIVALEYFLDSDPGHGNAIAVPVPAPDVKIAQTFAVDISQTGDGVHSLFVRALDEKGRWSITQYNPFVKVTQPEISDIAGIEWFIDDNDPGFGKAEQINLAEEYHSYVLNLTAMMEAGLTSGQHTMYIRAKNQLNRWSITQMIEFVLFKDTSNIAPIKEIEWFVDEDPGYGAAPAGQHFTYADPQRVVIQPFTVDIESMDYGWHRLFVRAKDTLGHWGVTQHSEFVKIKSRGLAALEYFMDTDPGYGHGTAIPLAGNTDSRMFAVPSSDLADGVHTLFVRARNEADAWGVTQYFTFVKTSIRQTPDVERAEWFVDTDPGFGAGHSFAVPAGSGTTTFSIHDLFHEGLHTLYVRAIDKTGHWSVTQHFPFYTLTIDDLPDITAMEWFIDIDPGVGQATAVLPITPGQTVSRNVTVSLASVEAGMHRIYTRVRTSNGHWSITQYVEFVKIISNLPSKVVDAEYFVDIDPGFGGGTHFAVPESGTAVFIIDGSLFDEGLHTLYVRALNEAGRWSVTQHFPFYTMTVEDLPDIIAMEWFVDIDPGFGKATAVPSVTPGQTVSRKVTLSLPSLETGMHRFYARAQTSNGDWSITQNVDFVKVAVALPENIVAVEYFIDTDHGFGQETPVSVIAGTNVNVAFIVDVNAIPDGIHTLYVRAKNENGRWSITNNIEFVKVKLENIVLPGLAAIEYFFDSDPGYTKGTSIPISGVHVSKTFTAVIPPDLQPGLHTLFVRAVDTLGHWGQTQYNQFLKVEQRTMPNTVAVEYFFDSDPGFGQATQVVINPASQQYVANIYFYPEKLTLGEHTLYVRTLDDQGKWSHTQNISMIVVDMPKLEPAKIMAIEYFFDNDPGFGNAKHVNVSPTQHDVDRRFFVPATEMSVLGDGLHTLYIRAMDVKSQWSITHTFNIIKVSEVKIVADDIVRIEYFFDIDPGFGHATGIPVSPSDRVDKIFTVGGSEIPDGPHVLYVRAISKTGRWSITQYSINLDKKVMDPEDTDDEPKGGTLTPSRTELCQYSKEAVTLTLSGYELSINWWEYRRFDDDGAPVFGWRTVGSSGNHPSMIFTPDEPGTWEYRVHVSRGDRGPEYSTIASIVVIGAAKGGIATANTPEFVCSGKTFTVQAEDYKGAIVGWQQKLDDGAWEAIPASATETFTVTPSQGGEWHYRMEVAMGECSNAFSDEVVVPVIDAMTGGKIIPPITSACTDRAVELEATKYLGNIASWEVSDDEGATWQRFAYTEKYYRPVHADTGKWLYRAVIQAGNCDETYSQPSEVTVVSKTADAGEISGPNSVCKPDEQVHYIVPLIGAAEHYEWTLPTGVVFASNPDANEVWLTFTDAAITGIISVKGTSTQCGEGTPSYLPVTVNERPAVPVITGPDEVNVGNQYTYSVPLTDNTTYTWDVPTGWTVVSQTDNTITVIPLGISGNITVTVTNDDTHCTSDPATKSVLVQQCIQTGPIYRLPNRY